MPKTTNQKQHILETALKLFAARGYGSTSTRLIASTAGVSLGLLYNFFKNKEDLLREIVMQGFGDIQASMKVYNNKSLPPQQAIEIHVTTTFRIIREHDSFWRLLHTIRLQEKSLKVMRPVFKEMVDSITDTFTNVFRTLGYKNPNLEAVLFLTQIDGLALLYLQDGTLPIDKLSKQLIARYQK